jgi:hypothetical protein
MIEKLQNFFPKFRGEGGGIFKKKIFRKYKMINKFILDLRPSRPPDLPTSGPPNLRPSTRPKIFHSAAVHMSEYKFVQNVVRHTYCGREKVWVGRPDPTKNSSRAPKKTKSSTPKIFILPQYIWVKLPRQTCVSYMYCD